MHPVPSRAPANLVFESQRIFISVMSIERQEKVELPPVLSADVLVVGAGPTGLLLTHLLAKQGVRVCLMEQLPQVVGEARAVSIDDESLRSMADALQLEALAPLITHAYGVHYYSWLQTLFAKVEPRVQDYGHPKRNAFRQQQLVQTLFDALKAYPHVEVLMSSRVLGFTQEPLLEPSSQDLQACPVTVSFEQGEQVRQLLCRWLVGADGARSTIRELMGTRFDGQTHAQRWLIADLVGRQDAFRHTRTYCDPKRPAIRLPGPQSTLRYEFMLFDHEKSEEVLEEQVYRSWIKERNEADADLALMRKVVYSFHARVAKEWQKGRVFLAGDAAHLTPPFAGQGMNSGVRDASNLAWKLADVVKGRASTALLGTYQLERKPHAWALIQMALKIGVVMQPRSMLGAIVVQTLLKMACWVPRVKDYFLNLKFKPKPRFFEGFFDLESKGRALIAPGQLMVQPPLESARSDIVKMDSVLGSGFAVLSWWDAKEVDWPQALDLKVIKILRQEEDFLHPSEQSDWYRDVDGHLQRVLDSAQACAVILRPDHYVLSYVYPDDDRALSRLQAILFGYYT